MKYKNRLTFACYNITFWDFKSIPKTWQKLKAKHNLLKKKSKYRNAVDYDLKSQFLVIFSSNYRHRLVLKIPFPWHIFPQISKYRTKNLYFPSTGKYKMNIKFHFIINIDFFQSFCLTVFYLRTILYLNTSAPLSTQKQMTYFMVRFRLIVSKLGVYCC